MKFYAITKVFGNGGTIITNGDESNEIAMSKYQTIQPNRILVRFNIKLWQFIKKINKVWNAMYLLEKENKTYSKKNWIDLNLY